ncbi:very-short-patch-repair endonuclease [Paractinoplanes brasiliensis]|uniref:Very-short-patch-repair endonuclease n=1 Tax=Paractinoplanes brasiliensis TaxID=52695 RepID=A0A4R6JSR2_9ACTN|nr:very-short-patch-repair endonuclease [Actinoplanes brasiliensis]
MELLPAWLPEASAARPDVGGLAAARLLAAEMANKSRFSRTFLTDLAVLALTGRRSSTPPPLRIRARELARLVAEAFGRRRTVLLVDVTLGQATEGLITDRRDSVVAGAEWLVHNGGPAVWLLGAAGDRVPVARPAIATSARGSADRGWQSSADAQCQSDGGSVAEPGRWGAGSDVGVAGPGGSGAGSVAGVAGPGAGSGADRGRPHPASAAEAALEAALAVEPWAAGRRWNQDYRTNELTPPVRLDLLWPQERCVVEIDGPEHCHPVRFEADRRRDVQLQLDGYAVLRFTNARITHDLGAVVHQIGTYVRARRRDHAEGSHHGRR